jgi:TRAP-type C4-dicarboxylate transport system substrate-binding protein
MLNPRNWNAAGFAMALLVIPGVCVSTAAAQNAVHYRFAYDQPRTTGYGVAADIFSDRLRELSQGAMLVDQFPGAQLGQEPQVLQLLKSGDIDFAITSTANTATISPQAGVMSLHFLFRSEDHVKKAIADPKVVQAVRDMIDDTVQGTHVIGLATLGLRSLYGKKEVHKIADLKGLKVRVQATATEDAMFPAYGAQTVHMPFGSVYTSLQTGLVDFAENGTSGEQALRGGAHTLHKRARGQQQRGVDQRQALVQPQRRAKAVGACRRRRGQSAAAGQGVRSRTSIRDAA